MYRRIQISNDKYKGSRNSKNEKPFHTHHFHSVDECLLKRCGSYENKDYTGTSTDADEAKKAGCHLYADEIFSYKDQLNRDYPSLEQIRDIINKNSSYILFTPYS